ncbi:MAG TPA: M24 family metallopeptidase [Actinomycetes bacterium]|nr:M24 family metallopeptidase [Actinomycetes bacterium]
MVPDGELERRRRRLRELVDGRPLLVHGRSNLRYLTGYDGGGFVPWLLLDDSLALVHYTAEEDSLAGLGDRMDLLPFGPAESELDRVAGMLRRVADGRVVGDLHWWTAEEYRHLGSRLGDRLEDGTGALTALRARKSEWEREQLRAAGRITTRVMDRLEELAGHGASGPELAIALHSEAIRLGSGPLPPTPFVAVGPATFENHKTWDDNKAVTGPYLFEFATSVDGYSVPLSRSRTDDPDGRRALDGVERGLTKVQDLLAPGAPANELDAAMRGAIAAAGFELRHRAGYSIGLGEADTWMEGIVARLAPQATWRLEAGMTFHVVGSVVRPGAFGVARSASVLITDDGYEPLAH